MADARGLANPRGKAPRPSFGGVPDDLDAFDEEPAVAGAPSAAAATAQRVGEFA